LILRRALLLIVALAVVGAVAAWFARAPLLRAAAEWWIVSDPIEPSDVVAVFGGGLEDRPFAAASYYQEGLVKRVLLSDVRVSPAEKLGIEMSHVAANRAVLLKLGVPDSAIEVFGADLTNTHDEAVALRQWAIDANVHSIIVPTEIFSARRLDWMLHRAFGGDVSIRVVALDPLGYNRTNWWRSENGIIGFQNEIVKYFYYRAKY
jgi:uncharacterized SAM-binding protein YcdF (DUF218 family)